MIFNFNILALLGFYSKAAIAKIGANLSYDQTILAAQRQYDVQNRCHYVFLTTKWKTECPMVVYLRPNMKLC